jgi:heme-degrading monooxygenase HmoA
MIQELVRVRVKPGFGGEFEAGVAKAEPLFRKAKGCHGVSVKRSIDHPEQYWLTIWWETKENHIVDFAGSNDFRTFGALVGHCFAAAPEVDHVEESWTGS